MTEVRGRKSEVSKRKKAHVRVLTGLTERVRCTAKGYKKPFRVKDLIVDANIITRQEADCVYSDIIPALHKYGELRRVSTGTYEYVQKEKPRTSLDIIWHLIRSHRRFNSACIERLSGVKRKTVQKYLCCLTALGYLRKDGFYHWQLVNDTGPDTPRNIGKRVKKLREANAVSDSTL